MPTKNTKIISARVSDDKVELITQKANKRRITINAWINWAIKNGLRSHKRKVGD